jgi:ribosomal protein S27AE
MIKCPNCGSTAQIALIDRYHYGKGRIAEEYDCRCGTILVQHYALITSVVYTEDKVKYIKEDE